MRLDLEIELIKANKRIMRLEENMDTMKENNKSLEAELKQLKSEKRTKLSEAISLEGLKVLFSSFYSHFAFARFLFSFLINFLKDDIKVLLKFLLGNNVGKYCPVIRSFAITLQSFSSRAYDFVRNKFDKNLPHAGTIRKWYLNAAGNQPGITEESISYLKYISSEKKEMGQSFLVSLSFDEMAIKKNIQWIDSEKRFSGYVNVGKRDQNDEWPVANQSLVFLVNGINHEVCVPVAYYFITALNAKEKSELIFKVIEAITSTDAIICTLTFGGLASNFSMLKELGADYKLDEPKTYFVNPYNQRILCFWIHAIC